jgi:glutathione S-transferase
VPPATLITIPFSHYCEKARWALDWAGVPYVEQGHVPGFHRVAVRRAGSPRTSVPVLVSGDRVLSDSTDILDFADAQAPSSRKLYPTDAGAKADVEALVADFDKRFGPNIRRVLYFYLLPRRELCFALMDQRTPAGERALPRITFPLLRAGMRRFMSVEEPRAMESKDETLRVLDAMEKRLGGSRPYLVGDRFTAADLTFASLVAPAIMPLEHSIRFPSVDELPGPAADLVRDVQTRPIATYVRRVYREHRPAASPRSP